MADVATAAAHPTPPPLSVAVTAIGIAMLAAICASISSQLVDLGIGDIGGAFHLSSDDASWLAAAASMSEIAAVPVAATLSRALTLKRVLPAAAAVFALMAALSLAAPDAALLMPCRIAQSFAGGIMSVLMMVTVVATLPPGPRRQIGLAVFAFASTAPTALNATVGAFMSERFGWQGLYYFDIAWASLVVVLSLRLLKPAPPGMALKDIDWAGYIQISIGLAALILFMKQGDRFFWLENQVISAAGLLALILIPLALVLMARRQHPLMILSLIQKPSFGWAIAGATFFRFGLVMTAFVVPQA